MSQLHPLKNAFIPFIIFCIIALGLFWYTHIHTQNFWLWLPISSIILIILAIPCAKINFSSVHFKVFFVSIISGILLYLFFYIGNQLFLFLFPESFSLQVQLLYETLQPETLWNWILLFILIIPAEEIIWRGYIQGFLQEKQTFSFAIMSATALYMLSLIFSISPLLLLAALFGGMMWGILYAWSKNLLIPIVSHIVFDLCLLCFFPLT